MRKWYKYYFDDSFDGIVRKDMDKDYNDHSSSMGTYLPCESYDSKEAFFNKYYFGADHRKFGFLLRWKEYYNDFLEKHLDKAHGILSIGSGRCANELFLAGKGYKILCSDLEQLPAYDRTKKLFPDFEYMILDILESPAPRRHDAVISLSLIYLFDSNKLERFFNNVAGSMKTNGVFILDSGGAPDNLFSYLVHDIMLKYEAKSIHFLRRVLKHKRSGLVVKHEGYLRSDAEIVKVAAKSGLVLRAKNDYDTLREFRRSVLFNKFIKEGSAFEKMFEELGRGVPFIRMFKFEKVV